VEIWRQIAAELQLEYTLVPWAMASIFTMASTTMSCNDWVDGIMIRDRAFASSAPDTRLDEVLRRCTDSTWQDLAERHKDTEAPVTAIDLIRTPVALAVGDSLRHAFEVLVAHGIREAPVEAVGSVISFIDEAEIVGAYLSATTKSGQG
jgi:hypothetical protein